MYVYRFLDQNRKIIYVGKTKAPLRQRFYSHRHLPEKCYLQVYTIEYIECSTESDMSMKEIFYINKYRSEGEADYNTADVSSLPHEFVFEDNWMEYIGSLPDSFGNSKNYLEGYKDEFSEYIIASDGRHMQLSQNSIAGVSKYVYPFSAKEVELVFEYYLQQMSQAENYYREFAHFKNILLIALGISTPFKTKEILELQYGDLFDEDDEVKGYTIIRSNIEYEIPFPEKLVKLLHLYRKEFGLSYETDKGKYIFVGNQGQQLSDTSIRKSISLLCKDLNLLQRHSNESLRKTFFRYIFDKSEDKMQAIECIEFMSGNYHHVPAQMLKYIDVIPNDREFNPWAFMKDKYILDDLRIDFDIKLKFQQRWAW